ncbi:calcium-binding protein [Maridesulfovibrio zosterae]|uniref:calcium-binding protein n=1 Tax=Maridesulfovibrio zosterae TaxID=82171 RepID=UPI00041EDBBD|nr:calcium-binding protein [Maridesulfovibrio zosterae]
MSAPISANPGSLTSQQLLTEDKLKENSETQSVTAGTKQKTSTAGTVAKGDSVQISEEASLLSSNMTAENNEGELEAIRITMPGTMLYGKNGYATSSISQSNSVSRLGQVIEQTFANSKSDTTEQSGTEDTSTPEEAEPKVYMSSSSEITPKAETEKSTESTPKAEVSRSSEPTEKPTASSTEPESSVAGNEEEKVALTSESNYVSQGTDGDDTVIGTVGDDILLGGAGNDIIIAGSGNDALDGGDGNDILSGGAGADRLNGGAGTDAVDYSSSSAVYVDLEKGTGVGGDADGDTFSNIERVQGSAYGDTITGDGNDNALWGVDGDDNLFGNSGDDTLYGGDGNDALAGDAGTDYLAGGAGNDAYIFHQGSVHDVIIEADDEGNDMAYIKDYTNVRLYKSGDDLLISSSNKKDMMQFQNWFSTRNVESFYFETVDTMYTADEIAGLAEDITPQGT